MTSSLNITSLSFEQNSTGLGIGTSSPRISWRFTTDTNQQNWEQTAYDIEIVRQHDFETEKYHVQSTDSVLVPWPSRPLESRGTAQVRVRAYGGTDSVPTEWTDWSTVECGLLSKQDWKAHAITGSVKQPEGPLRPIRFRKTFTLPVTSVSRARLYITSLGVFQAYINGVTVGDHLMAPGWTSYHHRLNYEIFDVSSFLRLGESNTIAVEVAEGWYATRLGFHGGRRFIYGDELALIAQLEIQLTDGDERTILSDSTWKCHQSAIISSEIYDGEVYSALEEQTGWNSHTLKSESSWNSAREIEFPKAELVVSNAPPVRVTQTIKPIDIITTPSNKKIMDFGQNLVGRVRIPRLNIGSGDTVVLTHAEVLENKELGTRPLRVAKCTDKVTSAGDELDWAPRFTFHGFRYVQIDNWTPDLENIVAEVIHTDLTRTGWFNCSHGMINQLHENATWSMRGNFLSIPTDCPQRDERLGWTGDIQVFAPSASFLYNTSGMLGDWLKDLSSEQLGNDNAIPPLVIPNVISEDFWPTFPQAIWDDVTILLPWTLYQSYGDIDILRKQYPSMTGWLDRGVQRGPDRLWDDSLFQLGDWLDPTAPPDQPGNARTDGTLVADAYLVHATGILGQISTILGEPTDETRYKSEYQKLKLRFRNKYVSAEGWLVGDTQTALALVLVFDLLDDADQIAAAGARLARSVRKSKFQVSTGFAGTPLITHALTRSGYPQLAYRMLQEKNCPSWMYPITMGATTIWERWDSMLPDGSINPGEMTSFNHYALGSIINWLHKTVAGVSPLEPGWRHILIQPVPGGTVTSAEAIYETPYGRLECRWEIRQSSEFHLEVIVPPNSKARVVLPSHSGEKSQWIGSGRHEFSTTFDSQVDWPPKALLPPMFEAEDSFV
ncbi:unnamed protein product [Penicillium salamii]|nr:unnamed protein product [Penicillium salamii]CAG8292370.1 unnamed protein product [Penicillium salamii]CAG8400130.1 unnamed protein product [Penicillium salamii]